MNLFNLLSSIFLTTSVALAQSDAIKEPRAFQLLAVLDLGNFKEGGIVGPVSVNLRGQLATLGTEPLFTGLLQDDGRVKVLGTQSWLGFDETNDTVFTDVFEVGDKSNVFTIVNEQFLGVTEQDSKGDPNTSTFVAIRDPEDVFQYLIYNRRYAPKGVDGKPILLRVFWENDEKLKIKGKSYQNLSKFLRSSPLGPSFLISGYDSASGGEALNSFSATINAILFVIVAILF